MSTAAPMDPNRRALNYLEIKGPDGTRTGRHWGMTPAQGRRWRRKVHRYDGTPWPLGGGKGRPTPRQKRRPAPQIESQNLKRTGER